MSGLSLAVAPTVDPVTLADARAHCRIDDSESDAMLATYILAARQYIEAWTGRVLITQRWDLKLDSFPSRIVIPNPPLSSVVSITYVDTAGATQTLAANQYQVGKGDLFGFIDRAYGVSWPATRDQADAVTVRFEAGYGTNPGDVPEPLRLAILLLVGHWNENRETVGNITTELPFTVAALLQPYRTYGWL
jgi:uncharacterized phiE125 gp8 family phage protein